MDRRGFLKSVLALALLSILFWFADVDAMFKQVLKADLVFYFSAVLLFLTSYPVSSLRWRNLCGSIGYDLSLRKSFQVISVSYSFNKLLPGNAGDAARSKIFERYRGVDSHGEILGVVALERYLGMVSLLAVVAVSVLFIDFALGSVRFMIFVFGLIGLILTLVLLTERQVFSWFESMVPGRFSVFLEEVWKGYRSLSREDLFLNLGYSVYIRVLEAVVFYLLVVSLGAGLGFWEAALITSLMSLISVLPITPAGLGAVDAAGTGLVMLAGLDYSVGLTLVLMQRSIGVFLVGLVGGLIYSWENLSA